MTTRLRYIVSLACACALPAGAAPQLEAIAVPGDSTFPVSSLAPAAPSPDAPGEAAEAPQRGAIDLPSLRHALGRVQALGAETPVLYPGAARADSQRGAPSGDPLAVEAGPDLSDALAESPESVDRLAAVAHWADSADAAAVDMLLRAVIDPAEPVRRAAVQGLRGVPPPLLYAAVLQILATGEPGWAEAVAQALPEWQASLSEPLAATVGDPAMALGTRQLAAYALGRTRASAAVPTLTAAIDAGPWPLTYVAANALATVRAPEAAPTWRRLLASEAPLLRQLSLEALVTLEGEGAAPDLYAVASGTSETLPEIQYRAMELLYPLDLNTTAPMLVQLMRVNPMLQARAAELLTLRTGFTFGPDVAAWEAWLQQAIAGTGPWQRIVVVEGEQRSPYDLEINAPRADTDTGQVGWLRRLLGRITP